MRQTRLTNSLARRAWLKLARMRAQPASEPRFIAQPRNDRARATVAGGKA